MPIYTRDIRIHTLMGAVALVVLPVLPVAAQQVVPARSEIGFVSKQMGVPVEGVFKRWTAQLQFDPRKPEVGTVAFTIDTGSASLGVPETDAELPKADWFNVAKFPQATFQSNAIKALGSGRYEVKGRLMIKGATQDMTVPVALTQSGSGAALQTSAQGQFTIKRLAFKIGDGAWGDTSMVADDVQVRFKLTLNGMAPL